MKYRQSYVRSYIAYFFLQIKQGLQYRTAAFAGAITQFCWGFMLLFIFQAFYQSNVQAQPISYTQIVQILWLQQAFLAFFVLWFRDNDIFTMILTGSIAYELCRPIHLYSFWFVKLISARLSSASLRSIPILLVAAFLPAPYSLNFPPTTEHFVYFFLTLFLGLILLVAISMFVYISTFYTYSAVGSMLLFAVFGEFFAGLIIPVPLMPLWLQKIVYALPFRYTCDVPFRIYAGHIGIPEAIVSIYIQLGWILFLVVLGRCLLQKSLQKVVVHGG